MDVSVIIPAIDEQDVIADAVQSAAEAGADQIVVVDGGSKDRTVGIASGLGAEVSTSRPGRATQQNTGARQARGDVLLFLHADNRLAAQSIAQIRNVLQQPQIVTGAFRQSIDAAGFAYRALEFGNALRARGLGLPYGDQGIFVRTATFREVGGFPEIPLMEDVVLMRNCRRIAWPVLLQGPIYVNPRRWQQRGVIRQTLCNWCLVTAHRLGVSPERLAKHYQRHHP